ncbi:hypothetical protein ACFXD5_23570 [Streptomyces sp. NPDC059385]|uniref:hypothetical protein n=1 Tax=Streptomyces sp. NPDC059385 TaxID=3346817 RepID=UPI0036D06466
MGDAVAYLVSMCAGSELIGAYVTHETRVHADGLVPGTACTIRLVAVAEQTGALLGQASQELTTPVE